MAAGDVDADSSSLSSSSLSSSSSVMDYYAHQILKRFDALSNGFCRRSPEFVVDDAAASPEDLSSSGVVADGVDFVVDDGGALCPICNRRRRNETALSVSGFVFCYKCILNRSYTE